MVQCYYKNDDDSGLVRSINSGVCLGSGSAAGFYSCCFPWGSCLPNGLCYANASSTYYTALCTDQTLQDSACQKACGGFYRTGVTYNSTADLWACCDQSDPTCSTVTNETFSDPSPDTLRQHTLTIVDFIPTATGSATSVTATSSPSSSSSSSSSASPAASQDNSGSSSLSKGAIAGISVGIAIAVITFLVGLAVWIMRRRRRAVPTDTYDPLPARKISVEKLGSEVVEAPDSFAQIPQKSQRQRTTDGVFELD